MIGFEVCCDCCALGLAFTGFYVLAPIPQLNCIVAVTGVVDYVVGPQGQTYAVANGHEMMTLVTVRTCSLIYGTGEECALLVALGQVNVSRCALCHHTCSSCFFSSLCHPRPPAAPSAPSARPSSLRPSQAPGTKPSPPSCSPSWPQWRSSPWRGS